ncbi:MAG: hypothetical protein ACTSR7_17455 [Promethearchaeota archaeon]
MLKCVKCGSSDDLVQYKFIDYFYVRSGRKKVIPGQETVEMSQEKIVPTCSECFDEFKEWDSKNSKVRNSRTIMFIFYLLAILAILTAIGSPQFWPFAIIFCVITCFLMNYRIKFSKKINALDSNPHNYLMFGNNKFFIKPEYSNQWIDYDMYMSQVEHNVMPFNELIKPIKRTNLPEEYQILIEKLIFKILRKDKRTGFTSEAIKNRIHQKFNVLDDQNNWVINKTNVEWVLESMVSHKKITRKQRIYYSYK